MISEGVYMLLLILAILSAYTTFLYNVPSALFTPIAGIFSGLLFALVALTSDAVYSDIGNAGMVFNYAPIKILAALCCTLMVFGVFLQIMSNGFNMENWEKEW
jgi:hypothetical protein